MKAEQVEKLENRASYVRNFAQDILDTIEAHRRFARAKGMPPDEAFDARSAEYFRGKLALMKDYVGDALDMVEAQQRLDEAKPEKA